MFVRWDNLNQWVNAKLCAHQYQQVFDLQHDSDIYQMFKDPQPKIGVCLFYNIFFFFLYIPLKNTNDFVIKWRFNLVFYECVNEPTAIGV